jgi:phosphonate transport system permease protein
VRRYPVQTPRGIAIETLWRRRIRYPFAKISVVVFVLLAVHSCGVILARSAATGTTVRHRIHNFTRFATEICPYPICARDGSFGNLAEWAADIMNSRGWSGSAATLAISILAITFAAICSSVIAPLAARTLTRADPYLPTASAPSFVTVVGWTLAVCIARSLLIVWRSFPPYLWAFIFVSLVGPTAWPAVLTLGIHNAGIVGKLSADTIENLDSSGLSALRALGSTRTQITAFGIAPAALTRFLVLVFYRWETCVRDATVLGMLGIGSLGFWIQEARASNRYDEMVFLVLLGAGLVIAGDITSVLVRAALRRA